MRRFVLFLALILLLPGICAGGPAGYRLIESAAASVNGEVIFLSEVSREVCIHGCGMAPGEAPVEMTLSLARQRLVSDLLVLQEQRKLGLGSVDNAALSDAAAKAAARKAECASPCAAALSDAEVMEFLSRRILVRDFLEKRVAVFIEVNDEEVARESAARARAGAAPGDMAGEKIRRDLFEAKMVSGLQSWFARAASKSRIVLSPMEEP